VWPGLSKLIEEAGEVIQVCGKIIGVHGQPNHWDGTIMHNRLVEELGDLLAAAQFVVEVNELEAAALDVRREMKLALFRKWHATPDRVAPGEETP
jgi:NTP pyrophosphatase (non-canonical NTP hydrolase)